MLDAIKPLLESGLIKEDIAQELNEAWQSKLNEAREQVRAELRDEFAQKYEHDRSVMVEALDKMLTENLTAEIKEFRAERQAMNEDRVKAQQKLRENATKFNEFMVTRLAEEIKELRNDRKIQKENQEKLQQFIVHALAREIKEFSQDKKAVVEAKVKLVAEGRKQLTALKQKFVKESAEKLKVAVTQCLSAELTQLKEDIKVAKENNFGRELFEAYACVFSATHLNEKAETRKLMQQLKNKEVQLAEAQKVIDEKLKLVESKEREVRIIKETTQRKETLTQLLSTLNREKAEVMKSLLESVHTTKLQAAFDKYLPAVLNNGTEKKHAQKQNLSESKLITEVTGDKSAKIEVEQEGDDSIIEFKNLVQRVGQAGL
jgi:hypothetical protein